MPRTEVFISLDYFRQTQSLSFAIRKTLAANRENSASYIVRRLQLAAVWLMVQITFFGTFYVVARLKKLLRTSIDLIPGGAASSSDEQIQSAQREIMKTASEVLRAADDARLGFPP
jgi:hypothetical protein